jgi:hypothetical protein
VRGGDRNDLRPPPLHIDPQPNHQHFRAIVKYSNAAGPQVKMENHTHIIISHSSEDGIIVEKKHLYGRSLQSL